MRIFAHQPPFPLMFRAISYALLALLVASCKLYYPVGNSVGEPDGIYGDRTPDDTATLYKDIVSDEQPYYGAAADFEDYDRYSEEKLAEEPHSNLRADADQHVTIYNNGYTLYDYQGRYDDPHARPIIRVYPDYIPYYHGYYHWWHPWYAYRGWNTWYGGHGWGRRTHYWGWHPRGRTHYYTPGLVYAKNPRYNTDHRTPYRSYSRSQPGATPSYSRVYRTYNRERTAPEHQVRNSRYKATYQHSRYSPPKSSSESDRKRAAVRSASRRNNRAVRVFRR